MTLAMWIKIDDDSYHGDIWRQLYGGGANFNITLTDYLALKGQPQNGPSGQFGWVYYDENVWYHMVVVIEGANIHPKWYKNGVKTGSDNSFSGNLSTKVYRNLLFGKQVQCTIKSINIWERALSATEVFKVTPSELDTTSLDMLKPLGSPCTTSVVNTPSPAGIVDPSKEKPRTTEALVETVNPASSAAPPEADRTVGPDTLNWKPAIGSGVLYNTDPSSNKCKYPVVSESGSSQPSVMSSPESSLFASKLSIESKPKFTQGIFSEGMAS